MSSPRLSPLKTVLLLALVVASVVISMSAAFAFGPGDVEGSLTSLGFLLVAIPLAYFAVRWTEPGWARWMFVGLVLILPSIVGIQLVAFRFL